MTYLRTVDGASQDPVAALEARMVVLEIVTMSALAMALDTSDSEQAAGIAELILETVDQRCEELRLSPECRNSAANYAQTLLCTTLMSLYPSSPH
jgi:hypothetical protein